MLDFEKAKNFEDALMDQNDGLNTEKSKNTKNDDKKYEEQKIDYGLTKKGKPRKRAAPGSPNASGRLPRKRAPVKKRN